MNRLYEPNACVRPTNSLPATRIETSQHVSYREARRFISRRAWHHKLWRLIVVVLIGACVGGRAAAQDKPKNVPAIPFVEFGKEPDKFVEKFFGQAEDDRQALEIVEVSLAEEQRFGKAAAESYLRQLRSQKIRVVNQGQDVEYLRSLVDVLKPQMAHADRYAKIEIHVADSPQFDARSFPGGTLVFFTGLLKFAENEAALAGIVGHELSHLDHGHQLTQIKQMKLTEQLAQQAGHRFALEQFFKGGATLMRLWSRPFRPEDEAQADRDGVTWAYRAGYDPREMARLFLRMDERHPDRRGFAPAFFRTHPFNLERHKAVASRFDELRQEQPLSQLYIGTENLRRRIPRSKQEFAE